MNGQAHRSSRADQIREEVGDLLFSALNVARFVGVDPETALQSANRKFESRFRRMEAHFEGRGRSLKEVPPEEMDRFWQNAKDDPAAVPAGEGEER